MIGPHIRKIWACLLIGLLFLPVIVVPRAYVPVSADKQDSPYSTTEPEPLYYEIPKLPPTNITYNVEIRNSEITDDIYISNYSKVLMDNVRIYSESEAIVLDGHAELAINNSIFKYKWYSYIYIYLYDESKIILSSTTADSSMTICLVLFNRSEARVIDIDMKTQITCYDDSRLLIYNTCNTLTVNLRDNSICTANYSDLPATVINCYENSQLYMHYSDIYGDIDCRGHSYLFADYCSIDSIEVYGNASIQLDNTNCSTAELHGDSYIHMFRSNISDSLKLEWTVDYVAMMGPGAWGMIVESYVKKLYIYSGRTTKIINSYIDYMSYYKIYNGNIEINETGTYADNYYLNYENISSTIVSSGTSSYYLYAVGAERVKIANTSYPIYIYLYNVSSATIENMDIYSMDTHVWYSTFMMLNVNTSINKNYFYNSTVILEDCNNDGYLYINARQSDIKLQSLNVSTTYGAFCFDRSRLNFTNTYVVDVGITVSNSIMTFDGFEYHGSRKISIKFSTVNGSNGFFEQTFEVYYSSASLYNVSIDFMDVRIIQLEDGYFRMENGMITEGNGTLVYGVENLGLCSVSTYFIDEIDVYNATINASGVITYSDSNKIKMKLYDNSSAYLYKIKAPSTYIDLYIYDSYAFVYGGKISRIEIYRGNVTLNSTTVTNEIYLSGRGLYAWNSSTEDIVVSDDSYIELEQSTVYEVYNVYGEESILGEITLPNIGLVCTESSVSAIYLISNGFISTYMSNIDYLIYAFQWVDLENSTVNYICFNTTVFVEGYVEIVNNRIVSGYYENRFICYGSTVSNIVDVLVVSDMPHEARITLHVENSSYYGIIGIGGWIEIKNTNLSYISLLQAKHIDVSSTEVNSTLIDLNIMHADYLYIRDTNMYSRYIMSLYLSGKNSFVIQDLLANVSYLSIEDSVGSVSNLTITCSDSAIHVFDSRLEFTGSHFYSFHVDSSKINATRTNLTHLSLNNSEVRIYESYTEIKNIWLYENSYLEMTNVIIDNLCTSPIYGGYYSKNMTAIVINSSIFTSYVKYYYVTSHLGATFFNGSASGEYSEKLSYINTNLSSASYDVVFYIDRYGRAIIENYTGQNIIQMLLVNSMIDTRAPTILPINGTSIEYELGLQANVCVKLYDATPTEYYVYLDGDLIDNGSYYNNMTLTIMLSKYINSEGSHTLEVYAYDIMNNENHTAIQITVYPQQAPVFISTPDSEYDISKGESIDLTWIVEDKSSDTYIIMINDKTVKQGSWQSGVEITYRFIGNETGQYNIVITVKDKLGLESTNTVVIKVEGAAGGILGKETSYILFILILLALLVLMIIVIKSRKKKK